MKMRNRAKTLPQSVKHASKPSDEGAMLERQAERKRKAQKEQLEAERRAKAIDRFKAKVAEEAKRERDLERQSKREPVATLEGSKIPSSLGESRSRNGGKVKKEESRVPPKVARSTGGPRIGAEIRKLATCPTCDGDGGPLHSCPKCEGTGFIEEAEASAAKISSRRRHVNQLVAPQAARASTPRVRLVRVVADEIDGTDVTAAKIVMLLKLESNRVSNLQGFGYLEDFSNQEGGLGRYPFVLEPSDGEFTMEFGSMDATGGMIVRFPPKEIEPGYFFSVFDPIRPAKQAERSFRIRTVVDALQ